jgi:hypothetical protein
VLFSRTIKLSRSLIFFLLQLLSFLTKILNEKGILQRVELKVCGEREAGLSCSVSASKRSFLRASEGKFIWLVASTSGGGGSMESGAILSL